MIRTFIEFLYSDSLRLVYESDVLATCLSNPSSVFSSTMEKAGLSFSAPVESNKVVSSQILTIPPFRNLPLDHYVDVILVYNLVCIFCQAVGPGIRNSKTGMAC